MGIDLKSYDNDDDNLNTAYSILYQCLYWTYKHQALDDTATVVVNGIVKLSYINDILTRSDLPLKNYIISGFHKISPGL